MNGEAGSYKCWISLFVGLLWSGGGGGGCGGGGERDGTIAA